MIGSSRNYLLLNNGSGFLADGALQWVVGGAGAVFDRSNATVDAGDVDLDGKIDLFVCYPGGPNRLFWNSGAGFVDRAVDWGLSAGVGGAAVFADVDGDGDPDLGSVGLLNPRVAWRDQWVLVSVGCEWNQAPLCV